MASTIVGMSSPASEWSLRLKEVGPIQGRRVFNNDMTSSDGEIATVASEAKAGRASVISFKIPKNDWKGVAAGTYDPAIDAILDRLQAVGKPTYVVFHHEPTGDGTASDWAAMQVHVAPMIRKRSNLRATVIMNGFVFAEKGGYTDPQIATYLTPALRAAVDVIAGDFYESGRSTVDALFRRFVAWADRVGYKGRLGVGEFGTLDATGLTNAAAYALSTGRFEFLLAFNSNNNNRDGAAWLLTDDRLAAFQSVVKGTVTPDPAPPAADPRDAQITQLKADLAAAIATRDAALRDRDVAVAARDAAVAVIGNVRSLVG